MPRIPFVLAAVCVLGLAAAGGAQAVVTQTFTTTQSEFNPGFRNQGWREPSMANLPQSENYFVGRSSGHIPGDFRNFFSFDLSSACAARAVTLQLTRFGQSGSLVYSLFDVSTPAAKLNTEGGPDAAVFNDLGSGASFGSFPVGLGAPTDVLSFVLGPAGVTAYNAARGGFFSVGGVAGPPASIVGLFAGSGIGTEQIVVTCVSRAEARQACIFERVAHGVAAFRAKYGRGPFHRFAMRRCIRARTGV